MIILKSIIRKKLLIIKTFPGLMHMWLFIRFMRNNVRYKRGGHLNTGEAKCGTSVYVDGYLNTFCGYYDISPFNIENNNSILIHANNVSINSRPNGKALTDILVYDTSTDKVILKVGTTRAWNWQQGARAGWLAPDEVVYNDYREGNYHGVIYNIKKNERKLLSNAIQCWSQKHYVSLSYEVLAEKRPDYGYFCHTKPKGLNAVYVKVFDFQDEKLIYHYTWKNALEDLNVESKKEILNTIHFNHVQFSPCGRKIAFLVRFNVDFVQRSSLIVADIFNGIIAIPVNNEIISHHAWHTSNTIIYWGRYKGQDGYFYARLCDGMSKEISLLQPDGHPVIFSEDTFITDTYPDHLMRRKLFKGDLKGNFVELMCYAEEPVFWVENRCDSHPSISGDKKRVQIDRMNRGRRFVELSPLADL